MKSTGVVRQLDTLGRIVIPIELRRTMDIAVKDTLEIFTEGDQIILKKYHPCCIFLSDYMPVNGQHPGKLCQIADGDKRTFFFHAQNFIHGAGEGTQGNDTAFSGIQNGLPIGGTI